jgi:hypothetical protein
MSKEVERNNLLKSGQGLEKRNMFKPMKMQIDISKNQGSIFTWPSTTVEVTDLEDGVVVIVHGVERRQNPDWTVEIQDGPDVFVVTKPTWLEAFESAKENPDLGSSARFLVAQSKAMFSGLQAEELLSW